MWAEMLNDRSFEGVIPAANWSYYDGKPNFCDRQWDRNPTWTLGTDHPFNGSRSARLTATRHRSGPALVPSRRRGSLTENCIWLADLYTKAVPTKSSTHREATKLLNKLEGQFL